MPVTGVILHKDVADSILTYSRSAYPREGILLLRGKSKKGIVEVESVAIPPMATHGQGFSSFNWNLIPIDLSFLGALTPIRRGTRCRPTRTCCTSWGG